MRIAEGFRKLTGKTEVGVPKFSPETREKVLRQARQFVTEAKSLVPMAGVDKEIFSHWVPKTEEFARPQKIGENPHAYHDIRHVAAVVGMEMFLAPVAEAMYQESLPRPLYPNAVYAGAKGHDLFRSFDVLGAMPKLTYRLHGRRMAREIREGRRFPELTDVERVVAADSIEYHDVDPRDPSVRHPEDELLSIVDREELSRLIYGEGFWPKAGRAWEKVFQNPFEKQRDMYTSHFFPGFAEKIRPLSTALYLLSLEGMQKGLGQQEAVLHAMGNLGMMKAQEDKVQPAA